MTDWRTYIRRLPVVWASDNTVLLPRRGVMSQERVFQEPRQRLKDFLKSPLGMLLLLPSLSQAAPWPAQD